MERPITEIERTAQPNLGRNNWVRLRTLVALRWLAIGGQVSAVIVASQILMIDLRLELCSLAIAASVLFNLTALAISPANTRLNERSIMLTFVFDLTQLAVLLFLTGGLSNPFSLLFLAPVTISATTLSLRSTLVTGALALSAISALVVFNMPLVQTDGTEITPPPMLIMGMWASLVIGVVFIASYAWRVTQDNVAMSQALAATQLALAREQRLTALGGVVAAAAHELGTPLATIKLVSTELAEDLRDQPDLLEDVELIRSQSERCREILKDMGSTGRDDALVQHAPLSAVIGEAADPHMERGKTVFLRVDGVPIGENVAEQPLIARRPEIIHGVRNLIQNAVDFATSTVWVDMTWDTRKISLSIGDDGPGFPADLAGQLGEPYVGTRRRAGIESPSRQEYDGMGLGLFIAKTLLERTGASLSFANAPELESPMEFRAQTLSQHAQPTGAIVDVVWNRKRISSEADPTRVPLGRNHPNRREE